VLTGCEDEADDDSGSPGLGEEATGRATITYTDVALSGEGASDASHSDNAKGYTIDVTDGLMTLTLTTPTNLEKTVSNFTEEKKNLFGDEEAVTPTPGDPKICVVRKFSSGGEYEVRRKWEETDKTTYQRSKEIFYIYVDADVVLSRNAKGITDGELFLSYSAINLPLKEGWNLVQVDQNIVVTNEVPGGTATVKIADTNVPWVLRD
jgi:hypothetical protein